MAASEGPKGVQMTTRYIRLSKDKRYGLQKNGELWRIEKQPSMLGYLADPKDFEEAVERDEMRLKALFPPPPEEEPEEEIF